jgi:Flp pilus assembly protein TadD
VVRERQVRALVEELCESLLVKDTVRDWLRAETTLNDAGRQRALHLADIYQEDVPQLNEASLRVAADPSAGTAAYELALKQAEAACRLVPDNWLSLTALGAAQYRLGRNAGAVATLNRATGLCRAGTGSAGL